MCKAYMLIAHGSAISEAPHAWQWIEEQGHSGTLLGCHQVLRQTLSTPHALPSGQFDPCSSWKGSDFEA